MKKIFTDLENLPLSFIPQIVKYNKGYQFSNSIVDCDFVLLPFWEVVYEYNDEQYITHGLKPSVRIQVREAVNNLLQLAKKYQKRVLVFQWSDNEEIIPIENAIFFRTSLYKSKQLENEFTFPSWKGDLLEDHNGGQLDIRVKGKYPRVGFRGSSQPLGLSIFDLFRSNFYHLNKGLDLINLSFGKKYEWNIGQILRKKAMRELKDNRKIKTDFHVLLRGFINQKDLKKRRHNRYRFIENVFNNDYNLCVRGAGNYSYRLYEILSSGRIPLFINTDCVLPLDFMIDWKKYCVWVESSDIDRIDQILLDFHNGMTDEDFEELQFNIRNLWDDMISPQGFYKHLDLILDRVNSKNDIIS